MKPAIRTTVLLALFAPAVWAAEALPTVKVYKTPTCGCCSNWVDHMKASGFKVTQTRARHILLRISERAPAQTVAARLEQVRRQIERGERKFE